MPLAGLLALIVFLWWADVSKILASLSGIKFKTIAIACILQCISILLINLQWHHLSKAMSCPVSMGKIFHINMAGTFVESITPSVKAGGELTKVLMLKSTGGLDGGQATALVAVQKVISFSVFMVLTLVSMVWFLLRFTIDSFQIKMILLSFVFLAIVFLLILALILWPNKLMKIINILPKRLNLSDKAEKFIKGFRSSFKRIARDTSLTIIHLVLAFIIWTLFPLKAYFLAQGLGVDIDFISISVITYLTYMVGMIPLLPGGIGTFEGSMVFFLSPLGVSPYNGVALAIALRFVTFWFVFLLSAVFLGVKEIYSILTRLMKRKATVS